jgi:hypothetical protein
VPELRHSEAPFRPNLNNNESNADYEEVPRVIDLGESGMSLPDLSDSDRDEEPYEKFMAEESGRSRFYVSPFRPKHFQTNTLLIRELVTKFQNKAQTLIYPTIADKSLGLNGTIGFYK